MRLPSLRLPLLVLALVALGACHSRGGTATAVSESPEASVRQSVALLRAGQFDRFWRQALPAQEYAMLRADWALPGADTPATSPAQRARFDAALHQLAAPDAEATINAQLQPWLAQARTRYGDQLPILVAVARALASGTINAEPDLTETQKRNATGLLQALSPWAQQAPWFDPDKARQAVGVLVATARQLDLRTTHRVASADFDQAMRRYAIAFAGIERVLALYGLPLDRVLASVRVVPLDYHPPYAKVRVESRLASKPLAIELTLVQRDGHWYDQDLIESVHRAHRHQVPPPASTTAVLGAH